MTSTKNGLIKYWLPLVVILSTSVFFRYFRFSNFLYWSSDEELAFAVVRRVIVDHQIPLISPNTNLGISLGSFFHLFSSSIFFITQKNLILVELIFAIFGILTAIGIFYLGIIIKDTKLGFIAAIIYSSSFFISIFDKRWWPLSLNSVLVTTALISLVSILQKKYIFLIPLAISIGFAIHADPSLSVIAIVSAVAAFKFRPLLSKKSIYLFLATIFLFALPLLLFELKHQGAIFKPIVHLLTTKATNFENVQSDKNFANPLDAPAKILFPKSSSFAEQDFCVCSSYLPPISPTITRTISAFLIFYPALLLLQFRRKTNSEKILIVIFYLFISVFLIGVGAFHIILSHTVAIHYYTILFPVIVTLISYSIIKLVKNNIALAFVVALIVAINFNALLNSSFRYPLTQKLEFVNDVTKYTNGEDFELDVVGGTYFEGGGFTSLFILNNQNPKKSYVYPYFDWTYKAHSLYTVDPTDKSQPIKVLIQPKSANGETTKITKGQMEAIITIN